MRTSWKNSLACCGSNAFNQLTGGALAMTPSSTSGIGTGIELFYPVLTPFQLNVKDPPVPGKVAQDSKATVKNKMSSRLFFLLQYILSFKTVSLHSNNNNNIGQISSHQYIKHISCGSNATCVVIDAEDWETNKLFVWGSGI